MTIEPREIIPLSPLMVQRAVREALNEDLGRAGDITTDSIIPGDATISAAIVARVPGWIAGLDFAVETFRKLDPDVNIDLLCKDGDNIDTGQTILKVQGQARAVLTGERVALNFVGHLSGIATATRAIVDVISGTSARITCTRKTTPGLRAIEKYAVRAGGGYNHRFGLDDGILIKDNHIAVAGGIAAALARVRANAGHMVKIEIEVDTLEQLKEALAAGADAVLLDNMDPATLKQAVAMIDGRAIAEASGRITIDTARIVADTGVDIISVGWLTHSAAALDVGLDIV